MIDIESTILSSLVYNEQYIKRVLPYLKGEYFLQDEHRMVLKLCKDYFTKYNASPTKDTLLLDLQNSGAPERLYEASTQIINNLAHIPSDFTWLLDNTEEFCKRQALYNAVMKSAKLITDQTDTKQYPTALNLVQDALSVSFDASAGHDYVKDAENRFEFYRRKKDVIPCNLESFNNALKGGFVNESLTVFLAPTGVGKSMFMCHFAADFLLQGKNVLYISMEMTEEQIGQRIDANLLDLDINTFDTTDISGFRNRFLDLTKKGLGKLKIKNYPAHSAHSGHFRFLLNEYKLKEGFVPDIIIWDYLSITGSAHVNRSVGLYEYNKTVAEEMRGICQEFKARGFTGVQVNREGTKDGDFDMTDIAESWGIPATADYMFGLIRTTELIELGQIKIKRLKDRHNPPDPYFFMLGLDGNKMRLYDLDQENPTQTTPETAELGGAFDDWIT